MAWRFTGRAHGMKNVGHGGPALLRRRTPHLPLLPCCRNTRAFFTFHSRTLDSHLQVFC